MWRRTLRRRNGEEVSVWSMLCALKWEGPSPENDAGAVAHSRTERTFPGCPFASRPDWKHPAAGAGDDRVCGIR
jgi:hypothetical protein